MNSLESIISDVVTFSLAFGLGCAVAEFGFYTIEYSNRCGFGNKVTSTIYFIFFIIPFAVGFQLIFDPAPSMGFFIGLGFMLYKKYQHEKNL
jgi:hypothetical protein